MRKFEINKNTTGEVSRSQISNTQQQGQFQQDARSETWSVDVYASDGEGVQVQDSLEQRAGEGRPVVSGNEVANQEVLRFLLVILFENKKREVNYNFCSITVKKYKALNT